MRNLLLRKFNTLVRLLREKGLAGTIRYLGWETDNLYVGFIALLQRNRIKIDDCVIDVNNPLIPLARKSQFVQGRFEQPERDAVKGFIDPTQPVVELGGSVGVVACSTNRLLDDPTRHVVVEAHPQFAKTLNINRGLNGCQFTVVQKAIAYSGPTVQFGANDFASSYLVGSSVIEVDTTTLAAVASAFGDKPFQLICDIEGAEIDVVAEEGDLLASRVSLMIVEMHPWLVGESAVKNTLDQLARMGFEIIHQTAQVYVLQNMRLTH